MEPYMEVCMELYMEVCMEPAWGWHGALHGAYKEAAWGPVWRCTKMYASNHTGLHGGTKQVCMELFMEPYMEVCMWDVF